MGRMREMEKDGIDPRRTFRNLSRIKQERITRAAVAEFGEKGYTGASINAIVERLGIAKGSIFQYFGDKKGLFLFVFDTAMSMVKDYLRAVREETRQQPLFERLRATLLAGVLFRMEHPMIYRLYLKILFEYDIPFRDELLRSLRAYSLEYLRTLLTDARNRGELREDLDLDKAAFILDAVMDRFLQAQTIDHLDAGLGLHDCDARTARAWVDEMVDVMRMGIGAGGSFSTG